MLFNATFNIISAISWRIQEYLEKTKKHSESISISVTEKFGFKIHILKYRKHLMRFFCCRVYVKPLCLIISGGRRGRDRMHQVHSKSKYWS
jgi:hypothetical protein